MSKQEILEKLKKAINDFSFFRLEGGILQSSQTTEIIAHTIDD